MKRTILLAVAAIVALMAASCQKEEMGRVLTATIEQYEHNSKAYINDEHYACWENGDAVSINGTTYPIAIENTTATIDAPSGLTGDLLAFYPADRATNLTSNGGIVKLQHLQTYEERNGHQIIDNPMAAYCPDGSNELRFRNLCALLKVTIEGNTSIKAIQVKGIDKQMLCGEAQLKLSDQGLPMLTSFANGSNSVTLNFETAEPITGSKSFYIVVPAVSNFEQLTIAVLTTDGTTYANNCKTSLIGQSLSRNQIGAISYTPNGEEDATFTPNWMIRYTATEEVDLFVPDFGSNLLSSSFDNGSGYFLFDGFVTKIPGSPNPGTSMFQDCTSITLPESMTFIGVQAFYGCSSLTSITVPENVTSIGNYVFQNCSSLNNVSLPASLTSIGDGAFAGCSSITSITLPASITSIGNETFVGCSSLTSITVPENVTLMGSNVFQNCSSLRNVTLPANLTTIGSNLFDGCSSLTGLTLPAGISSIKSFMFQNCTSLTSISLPENVTLIMSYVFNGCSNLTRVDCHSATPPQIFSQTFTGFNSSAVLHVPSGCATAYTDEGWDDYFQGGIEEGFN